MKEKNNTATEQNREMMNRAEDLVEKGRHVQDPTQGVLVRKQIGKKIFPIRVHFSEFGKEELQEKIGRMIKGEILADTFQNQRTS